LKGQGQRRQQCGDGGQGQKGFGESVQGWSPAG